MKDNERDFDIKINDVNTKLIKMLRLVENTIINSINSLKNRDEELAIKTINSDKEIDNMESEIETDCLRLLLLDNPVASDFRAVSATLKMITDLERIGDHARDISEMVLQFKGQQYIKNLQHISQMADIAVDMVKNSIDSYINKDLDMARDLDRQDDAVDNLFETIKNELVGFIQRDSKNADQAILFMMIAKYVERIGDHAVNIGEWVEYYITGEHKKF